jgi:hypothetical protein
MLLPYMILGLTSPAYLKLNFGRFLWIKGQQRSWDLAMTHASALGGTALTVMGMYNLPISIWGHKTEHPFRFLKGLNESVILGVTYLLLYDPRFKQIKC